MSKPPPEFASFARSAIDHGIVRISLDLLPSGWTAIPDFEPHNGRWLGPAARAWSAADDSDWTDLIPSKKTLDLSVALTLLTNSVGYLNWYSEVSLLFGKPTEIELLTGQRPDRIFIENCANTFGQGTASLPRHSDAAAVYANFGRLFEHPFRV